MRAAPRAEKRGSITTDDRGVDRISLDTDGNVSIFGTGIHLRVKGRG